jgi:hypothetical protein
MGITCGLALASLGLAINVGERCLASIRLCYCVLDEAERTAF